jgi:hypothetical protein
MSLIQDICTLSVHIIDSGYIVLLCPCLCYFVYVFPLAVPLILAVCYLSANAINTWFTDPSPSMPKVLGICPPPHNMGYVDLSPIMSIILDIWTPLTKFSIL